MDRLFFRIWKQPLALIKNFHLTSLGHKKARGLSQAFEEKYVLIKTQVSQRYWTPRR